MSSQPVKLDPNDPYQVQLLGTQPVTPCNKTPWIAAVVTLAIAGLVVAYFYCPPFHNLIDKTFTQVHLTGSQALLYIALPTLGAGLTIGLLVHIYRRHQEEKKNSSLYGFERKEQTLKETLAKMKPLKQVAFVGVAICAIALVAIAFYGASTQIPSIHDGISNVLTRSYALWEGLAYFGGSGAALATITWLVLYAIKYKKPLTDDEQITKLIHGQNPTA